MCPAIYIVPFQNFSKVQIVSDIVSYACVCHLQDRDSSEVTDRLAIVDRKYGQLKEMAELRKQRLQDALALYTLFNEADGVEQWITEKVQLRYLLSCCQVFQMTQRV